MSSDGSRVTDADGFCIEPARSARSRCRACRAHIAMAEPRFGRPEPGAPNDDSMAWYHLVCAAGLWPGVVQALVHRHGALGRAGEEALAAVARLEPGEVDLEPAVEAARAARWSEVVERLLPAWLASRDARVAGLIAEITRQEVERRGGIPAGRAWRTFVEAFDPNDALARGVRIWAAGRASKRAIGDELALGVIGPPDPRWADLLLPWLEDPPWQNAADIWSQVFHILDRVVDARTRAAIGALPEDLGALAGRFGWHGSYVVQAWVRLRDAEWFDARLGGARPIAAGQVGQIDAIEALVRARGSRDRVEDHQVRDLYASAAAGDDDALMVLADYFLGRDDPRGEFLQLHHARVLAHDRERRRRARQLEQKHWRELLGGLAPVVRKRGLVFRRGLPVHVVATARKPHEIEDAREAMEWASVVSLELAPPAGGSEGVQALLTPAATRLRCVRGRFGPASTARLLFEGPEMPSVRRVIVDAPSNTYDGSDLELEGMRCRFRGLEELVLPASWLSTTHREFAEALPGVRIDFHLSERRR